MSGQGQAASPGSRTNSTGTDLLASVVDAGLCSGCGLCAAACDGQAITMGNIAIRCEPTFTPSRCTGCGRCTAVCPGGGIDLLGACETRFGSPCLSLLGTVRRVGSAHATDPAVRAAGSSGGVISAMLEYLLSARMADRAVVLGPHEDLPYLSRYRVVDTPAEIRNYSQSRYAVNHLGDVLRNARGRLAIVTLPCQTHGLVRWSRLRESFPGVEWVLGLYCGGALRFEATRLMLRKLGIRDLGAIRQLRYRAGPWPGSFEATLSTGEVRRAPKSAFDAMSLCHTLPRCALCPDETNELADLSFADSWKRSQRGRGETLVLARSRRGEKLLDECIAAGVVAFSPVDDRDAVRMHAHHIVRRKIGTFRRMRLREMAGKANPDFGVAPAGRIGAVSMLGEALLAAAASGRAVDAAVRILPPGLLGAAMKATRAVWNAANRIALPTRWEVRARHG